MTPPPHGGVSEEFYVFKEQGVINLWRVLGLVGIKVKFKYHQPSGFNQSKICILVVSSFHLGGGYASCKNNLGICVRPLFLSFRKLEAWWFCYVVEL